MKRLTPSEFVEVCDALTRLREGADARGSREERGGGGRMAVEHEVLVAPVNRDGHTGEAFTALTRDISYAGLGFLQRTGVPQGTLLVVRLPRKDQQALVMLCRAVHVRELADGVYAVDAEFVRETTLGTPGADPAEIDRVRKAIMG